MLIWGCFGFERKFAARQIQREGDGVWVEELPDWSAWHPFWIDYSEPIQNRMRVILFFVLIISLVSACETPQEIQTTPNNTTNTTGTTGSATMTEKPATVGTGTADTTTNKKDSIPK